MNLELCNITVSILSHMYPIKKSPEYWQRVYSSCASELHNNRGISIFQMIFDQTRVHFNGAVYDEIIFRNIHIIPPNHELIIKKSI